MKNQRLIRLIVSFLLIGGAWSPASADTSMEEQIALARSAAPATISDDATIVVDGDTVVEGSNGWVCMPNVMPGDGAPVCVDEVWQKMMAALGEKAPYETTQIGVSYMLPGDPKRSGVSNSDPFHPNPTEAEDYVETGPHLMIIVPKAALQGITDDPSSGGPYVMWKDTDYAHLMVPVE